MVRQILRKAARDLQCQMRNESSVDLDGATHQQVYNWLKSNGFTESKVRKGRWVKDRIAILFDSVGGFLSGTP